MPGIREGRGFGFSESGFKAITRVASTFPYSVEGVFCSGDGEAETRVIKYITIPTNRNSPPAIRKSRKAVGWDHFKVTSSISKPKIMKAPEIRNLFSRRVS
jgi:hypothetical protein